MKVKTAALIGISAVGGIVIMVAVFLHLLEETGVSFNLRFYPSESATGAYFPWEFLVIGLVGAITFFAFRKPR